MSSHICFIPFLYLPDFPFQHLFAKPVFDAFYPSALIQLTCRILHIGQFGTLGDMLIKKISVHFLYVVPCHDQTLIKFLVIVLGFNKFIEISMGFGPGLYCDITTRIQQEQCFVSPRNCLKRQSLLFLRTCRRPPPLESRINSQHPFHFVRLFVLLSISPASLLVVSKHNTCH
jgi:hypothetical protein